MFAIRWGSLGAFMRRRSVLIGLIIVIVATVTAVVVYNVRPASSNYNLEPVGTTAVPPFTPPTGNDQPNVSSPPTAGQTYQADSPGLYAGNPDQPSCDRKQLITHLQENRQKLEAWSQVQGIQPQEMPAYVNELSSVVLRSDTYVTNYGFDGGVTTSSSILQAGTAVFVDKHGAPVAKCSCGNPVKVIAPPKNADPIFVGQPWRDFSAQKITIIRIDVIVIIRIIVVEIDTGLVFERWIGGVDQRDIVLDKIPNGLVMSGAQGLPSSAVPSSGATDRPTTSPEPSTTSSPSTTPTTTEPATSTDPPGSTPATVTPLAPSVPVPNQPSTVDEPTVEPPVEPPSQEEAPPEPLPT